MDGLDTPLTVDELVDALVEERERAPDEPGAATWEDVHERLHDEDLPALDEAGLLTFDEERGVVRRWSDAGTEVRAVASAERRPRNRDAGTAGEPDDRVNRYLLGSSTVAAAALAVTTTQVSVFGRLPTETVSLGVAAVVVVFALGAALLNRRAFGGRN